MATATIRRMHLTLAPSDALRALASLNSVHGGASGVAALSDRFRREIARELDRHADALETLARCVEWLCRKGIARVSRPRARGGPRVPVWLCPMELRADLPALASAAAEDAPEGAARMSVLALRAVLMSVSTPGLLEVTAVRGGGAKATLRDVLASLESALAHTGVSVRGPLPSAFRRTTTTAPATALPPSPPPSPPPPAPRSSSTGFGGLPDDAQSEDLRAGETLSARGLTPDAEFFLSEAAIPQWPCTAMELEKSRRVLMTRLHPDRAGETSTRVFHRVVKGHGELARKLTTVVPVQVPATVVATPPPAPPRTTVREWPPPPPPRSVPV